MKKLIKMFMISMILCVGLFGLVGCGNKEKSQEQDKEQINFLDDNKNYYISINGKKYYAGDKISDFEKSDFKLKESEADEKLPAKKYMIGAGNIQNSDKKTIFQATPYNITDSSIAISESVIGGIDFGGTFVNEEFLEELNLEIEVYGGITLGSTIEEVREVFGEPSHANETDDYTAYRYGSKEAYRNYYFMFDEDGKVTSIEWQNLVFNE